jgi:uroporphyrinogen decarboxylase
VHACDQRGKVAAVGTGSFGPGFERLARALRGKPDRVPLVAQMHEFAMGWTGSDSSSFYTKADLLASGIIRTAEQFGFDVPSLGYDVYNIELEALGQQITFPAASTPVADAGSVLVRGRADLANLRPPVPGVSGRMPFVLEVHRLFREATGVEPAIQFSAPFTLATLVRGYAGFIEDIALDPAFAHELLGFLTERVIAPWINAQKAALPEASAAVGADALCSPPMTSPAIIREFAIPYILRLRELCAMPVSVVNWWGESSLPDASDLLDLKRQVASGLIRAQDPDVERLGVEVFKEYTVRHGLALELGIGEHLLDRGPVSAIRFRIRDCIERAAGGGRLILYLTSLSAGTPPDNVRAAIEAVKEFGGYR